MPIGPDIKRITVVKQFGGAGGKDITNSYDVKFVGELDDPALIASAFNLAGAEKGDASDKLFFKHARIQYHNGKNAAGVKEKPVVVPLGFYGITKMASETYPVAGVETELPQQRILPPEVVLAISFAAGRSGTATHTYRYGVAATAWYGDGASIHLKDDGITSINNNWKNYLEHYNAACPVGVVSGKGENAVWNPVTAITFAGLRMHQQENAARKKPVDFDITKDTTNDAEDIVGNAVEVLQQISTNRYTETGANYLTSGKVAAMLATLGAALALIKSERDTGDYGPRLIPN